MRCDLGFFKFQSWNLDGDYYKLMKSKGFWFSVFGYGLHFTNSLLLFSERNGFVNYLSLPFGFRVKFLKREKSISLEKNAKVPPPGDNEK